MSTAQQRNSLRFYQGSINEYEMNTVEDSKKYMSSFYAKKSAYNVLNMLLCPGVDSEYTRIVLEKNGFRLEYWKILKKFYAYMRIFLLLCVKNGKRGRKINMCIE